MDKKFKFSDKTTMSKIVYGAVIAILCVSAIVIGIVVANSRKAPEEAPPVTDNGGTDQTPTPDGSTNDGTEEPEKKLVFVSPTVGTVAKSHSSTVPVFSDTLDEWRIHTGVDISTEDAALVYAAEDGEVVAFYKHPMLGYTIEIKHNDSHKSVYSNLDSESVSLKVGNTVKSGDAIGKVGDSAVIEIADEPHLHFELFVNNVSVNPLDYFTEESKRDSLGIVS